MKAQKKFTYRGVDLDKLAAENGPEFAEALAKNTRDHEADLVASCEHFYCGSGSPGPGARGAIRTRSVSMGSVPPEDFASEFEFPLDLIKVTTTPVFSRKEAKEAIALARSEDVDINEYTSGKYRLGGDWLKKMDKTRAWFNARLESTIFPAIAASFPEVVTNVSRIAQICLT